MAVRPIDANELYRIEKLLDTDIVRQDKVALNLLEQVLYDIQHVPTLAQPNEPLTLDELGEMSYTDWVWLEFPREKPSDNCWERGWKAYRLYSHERYGVSWIAYRRHPEGEEDT